jgi:PleD family two-component response regulator
MNKENILVIDDSLLICSIVERELSSATIKVLKAYDGKTAKEIVNNEKLSLILLDITLPDTVGYNICKQIKSGSFNSDIPVIFITSRENDESLVKAFAVGAIDYISKPFSSLELNARVKAHLENKRIKDRL